MPTEYRASINRDSVAVRATTGLLNAGKMIFAFVFRVGQR